ncbi:T7SS effector LXG polymorphic toxin [Rossellomorea marisflavi]|uniref:T7SS effector LXG polymorphic toxin n=1 Tax=Rossellomorea marisflavi TaxID=189381 RepID=UPI003D2ED1C0
MGCIFNRAGRKILAIRFAKQTTVKLKSEANNTIRRVSDIVTLPKIEDETCVQYVATAEREIEQSIKKLYEFDHAQTALLSALYGQVDALWKQIMQLNSVFQKLDFNSVLLPTKKFKVEKEDIVSFALDSNIGIGKFSGSPTNIKTVLTDK